MTWRPLGKKNSKRMRHLGKKSFNIIKHVGKKMPEVLQDVGGGLQQAGKIAGVVSKGAALLGQAEIAAPLMAASKGLEGVGKVSSGLGQAGEKAEDGDYAGSVKTLQKTVVKGKKDYSNFK